MDKPQPGILYEVTEAMARWKALKKANPNDPQLAPLQAEIEAKQKTAEYQAALKAEEKRMAAELKKLFNA
jgi:hypothetical protein